MTSRVSPMPLRSPSVSGPAPMALSWRIKATSVSSCVEPGVGSELLKFGLMKMSLPRNFSMPSSSMARFTPAARSVVLTKATCETEGAASNPCSREGANITAPIVLEASLRNCLRFIGVSSRDSLSEYWTPISGRNARDEMPFSGFDVIQHAFHQSGHVMVPLVPVMAACNSVELIAEMPGLQHGGEPAVCGQKTFLIAT